MTGLPELPHRQLLHLDFSCQNLLIIFVIAFQQCRRVQLIRAFSPALVAVQAAFYLFHHFVSAKIARNGGYLCLLRQLCPGRRTPD